MPARQTQRAANAQKTTASRGTTTRRAGRTSAPVKKVAAKTGRSVMTTSTTRQATGSTRKSVGTSARSTIAKPKATVSERLAALIPPMITYDNYIKRQIWGQLDMDVFEYARSVQKNMVLFGDTGAGKSMAIEAYCAFHKLPLVIISCNGGIDPATFWGMLVQDPVTGVIEWVDSDVTIALENGPAVIMLDEVNFTPPKITASFHTAMRQRFFTILERNNEKRMVDPTTWIVSAFNPSDRYQGTRQLNEAFFNRFALKIPWGYLREIEEQLVSVPVMLDIAEGIRDRSKEDRADFETPVSTNMLIEFEEFALDINVHFAIENFIACFKEDEQNAVREILDDHRLDIDRQVAEVNADIERMKKGGK